MRDEPATRVQRELGLRLDWFASADADCNEMLTKHDGRKMPKTLGHIQSLARSHTDTAIRVLVGIMNTKTYPAMSRVAAAKVLLDRGWGKPKEIDFLWLAPAPIKENLCGRDARHRRIGFGVHDADEHADGR